MFVWNQIKVVHYPFTHYIRQASHKLNSHIPAKPLQIGLNSLETYSLNGKHSNITLILCRGAAYKNNSWLSHKKAIKWKQLKPVNLWEYKFLSTRLVTHYAVNCVSVCCKCMDETQHGTHWLPHHLLKSGGLPEITYFIICKEAHFTVVIYCKMSLFARSTWILSPHWSQHQSQGPFQGYNTKASYCLKGKWSSKNQWYEREDVVPTKTPVKFFATYQHM